jgi:hypothetical protein
MGKGDHPPFPSYLRRKDMAKIDLRFAVADYEEYKEEMKYISNYDVNKASTLRKIEALQTAHDLCMSIWEKGPDEYGINDESDCTYALMSAMDYAEEIERLMMEV